MDAVECMKAVNRMLKSGTIDRAIQKYISAQKKNDYEGMVEAAEQWDAEYPAKTRQSVFLEQWPEARISNVDGFPVINPCGLDSKVVNECDVASCSKCRSKFWLAEVEE